MKDMKGTLKFILALGSAKLVMVEKEGQSTFYSKNFLNPSNRKTDLKRIAFTLASSR